MEKHPDIVFTDPTTWGRDFYGGSVLSYDDNCHLWFSCFHSTNTMASPQIGYAKAEIVGIDTYLTNFQFKVYPNPFSATTTIEYELKEAGLVSIIVYNHLGQKIECSELNQLPGKQQFIWTAKNLPSGIYFCEIKINAYRSTSKIIKQN